jgi:hypothetical protein
MRKLLLACALLVSVPIAAFAGPKEDAFQVIEQFKKAFDTSDVEGVVKLFAPEAIFLGTVSPKLTTKTEDINAYFQALRTDMPRKVVLGEYSTLVLSDTAVLFAGMDQFSSTKDGKTVESPHVSHSS